MYTCMLGNTVCEGRTLQDDRSAPSVADECALAAATDWIVRGVAHLLSFPKLSLKSGPANVGPYVIKSRVLASKARVCMNAGAQHGACKGQRTVYGLNRVIGSDQSRPARVRVRATPHRIVGDVEQDDWLLRIRALRQGPQRPHGRLGRTGWPVMLEAVCGFERAGKGHRHNVALGAAARVCKDNLSSCEHMLWCAGTLQSHWCP